METNIVDDVPRMMTVRQVAATGILKESAIRRGIRDGEIPVHMVGKKALINYNRLVKILNGE